MKELARIQKELKAPKGQFNAFGKYKYRSCEDILEAVKPLLGDCVLTINDEIVLIGDRYYLKATAEIRDKDSAISVSAFAREPLNKKGMDESQITGAASSYARKYALNGLFCIDDTKDADCTNKHDTAQTRPPQQQNNGAYVVPFGKFKGTDIKTIPLKELQSYVEYLEKSAAEQNKQITGPVKQFIDEVEKLSGVHTGQQMQNEIPF